MLNALTIDLEDWGIAVMGPDSPVTSRVVGNVERLLDLLDRHAVRATFFALGRVCETFPDLLPRVAAAGHEVASHGYTHELVYRQTPGAFGEDVRRSLDVIEGQVGRRPVGYRAPAFSITNRSRWAARVLANLGIRYSSSVFPFGGSRYGIADAPRVPHRWPECDLLEFPLATLRIAGRNMPTCGGGYLRLLPGFVHPLAIRQLNGIGSPAVVYVHPYELAAGEVSDYVREGWQVSTRRRFTQELWRSRVRPRLERLLRRYPFGAIEDVIASCALDADAVHVPPAELSPAMVCARANPAVPT